MMAVEEIHTYCPMCVAQCGVVAVVEDGRFTKVRPDSAHPNGGICVKGSAAPEMVYSPDRLLSPMKRTRPKGEPDPGWVPISWEEALDTVVSRLSQIRERYGAEAVIFGRATPSGSASSDFQEWLLRLANAFGSPNVMSTVHICTWNVLFGSKHTFGTPTPPPDYENARCILLWGANPLATFPTSAQRITRARARGTKLIVIDPRQHRLAREADCWLRVRPGSDCALALGMIHVLLEEKLYDESFVREWTNGPFLVREDTQRLLTAQDLSESGAPDSFVVWASGRDAPVVYDPETGYAEKGVKPELVGTFACRLASGARVSCRPAFALLADIAARYAPEQSEDVTWVPADTVRRAARLFATERPSCYFTWAGLEMHSNAMQTNRAVSCVYALTGQFDEPGSNVLTAMTPSRPIIGKSCCPRKRPTCGSAWRTTRSDRLAILGVCRRPGSMMRSSRDGHTQLKEWCCSAAIRCSAMATPCAASKPSRPSISMCIRTSGPIPPRLLPTCSCRRRAPGNRKRSRRRLAARAVQRMRRAGPRCAKPWFRRSGTRDRIWR